MMEQRERDLKDFPMNKPWGHDVNPDLWYIVIASNSGFGMLAAAMQSKKTGEKKEFPLSFGDEFSAGYFCSTDPELRRAQAAPMRGADLINFYAMAHLMEAEAAGSA